MLHTLWPRAADRTEVDLRVVLRARGDRGAGLRSERRRRVLGPGQPRGLARLRAHAAGHELARVRPRPLHDAGGRRARVRHDDRQALPGGAAMKPGFRRDRRRRRPQRADRGCVSRARGPARVRARAARPARRRVRDRGGVAGPARLPRLVCRLDAAPAGRRRPRAQALRLRPDPARPAVRDVRRRRDADPVPQRPGEGARVARARLAARCRPDAGVRGDDGARRRRAAADDAAPAAGGRLQASGRRARAAARGGPRRGPLAARAARALPRDDDVGRRPARRLVRERRAQGRLRVDRRGRRVGRPAHARAPPTTCSTTSSASWTASAAPGGT